MVKRSSTNADINSRSIVDGSPYDSAFLVNSFFWEGVSLTKSGAVSFSFISISLIINCIQDSIRMYYICQQEIREMSKAPLETEIREICAELADFLVEKNKSYGNSAAEPMSIFAKRLDNLAQIDVRIDDKLSRLKKGSEYPGDDTVKDLAGYLILRMVVDSL